MSRNVVVFTEKKDGKLRNVSYECVSAANKISEGGKVMAVVYGSNTDDAEQLGQYGADEIYVLQHEKLQTYSPDVYKQAMLQVIENTNPDVILLGHTGNGKDVAPRVAAHLGIGLISDCTDIVLEEDTVLFVRSIYAGKAFQTKKFEEGTIFVSLRPNNFPFEFNVKNPEIRLLEVNIQDLRTVIEDIVRKTSSSIDLSEAKVVVSGGRGVKSADGFKPLHELAEVLGGAVGASRGACDEKYCDYALQIGQTGKVVTPDLYIACGISGAIQHMAGMSRSKVIVAINKDPEAPIFDVADYGIVGDLFEVVPALTEEFRRILSAN
jgi:electron transfer flavoprotein alpha subunit